MARGYEQPETLQALFGIDQKLMREHGKSFDDLFGGSLVFEEESGYSCTPKDSVTFLWTGVDGDPFAFYTAGDSVSTLEHAPILFIQPMDSEQRVKIVAKNLKDFLELFIKLKELYVFENFSWYQSEVEFISHYEENYLDEIIERNEEISIVSSALLKEIDVPDIMNVFEYMADLNKQYTDLLSSNGEH